MDILVIVTIMHLMNRKVVASQQTAADCGENVHPGWNLWIGWLRGVPFSLIELVFWPVIG